MEVREIRRLFDCTQAEFAQMVGISSTSVGQLELHKKPITPYFEEKLRAFCKEHGIDCNFEQPCMCAEHLMKFMN